jgi:hypothetical protein
LTTESRATPARKGLQSTSELNAYQRTWFAGLRQRAAAGEPIGVASAASTQELFQVLDIPYVISTWWAAVVSARRKTGDYSRLLTSRGYPGDGQTSAVLGSAFVTEQDDPPWGGLPRPAFVVETASGDASRKIHELYEREFGADCYLLERSVGSALEPYPHWWEHSSRDWDVLLSPHRIDLHLAEVETIIRGLEDRVGRAFDITRLKHVMDLSNEQLALYGAARDLIARGVPSPVSVVDTMVVATIPRWHWGTVWARDAVKAFYDEIRERAARGEGAIQDEKIRLMWIGPGLWFNLGFYQYFEERFGAAFIWSMYLAESEVYLRYYDDGDPLRALAARWVANNELFHAPPWSAAWHLKEAQLHQVDGVVIRDPSEHWSAVALERAGIPVIELPDASDDERIRSEVSEFIEQRVVPVATARMARR